MKTTNRYSVKKFIDIAKQVREVRPGATKKELRKEFLAWRYTDQISKASW